MTGPGTDIVPLGPIHPHLEVGTWEYLCAAYLLQFSYRTRRDGYGGPLLRRWTPWCRDRGLEPLVAKEEHIQLWVRTLDEIDGLSPRTILGYLSPVIGVYRYAFRRGWISSNPAEWIHRPRPPRVSPRSGVSADELLRLLEVSRTMHPTVTAAMHLWGLNGTRWTETLAIDIGHIARHDDLTVITLPRRKGNVLGKISLSPPTLAAVTRARGARRTGPLLTRLDGHPDRIGAHGLRRAWHEAVRAAGIDRTITPHSLRHSFVTLSLDAGISCRDIMASTGHQDPTMIAYYDRARSSIERPQ